MLYTFIKRLFRRKKQTRPLTIKERLQPQLPIILYDHRRIGNTTRILDYLVQKLFLEGEVKVYDHWFGKHRNDTLNNVNSVYNTLRARLEREHPYTKFVYSPSNYIIVISKRED